MKITHIVHGMLSVMMIGMIAVSNDYPTDSNFEQNDMTEPIAAVVENVNEDQSNRDNAITSNTTMQQDDQTLINEKMKALGFSEIDISIDYPNRIDFEVEIDKNRQGNYKVELDNDISNKKLKGMDAFNAILPSLEKLNITKDTKQEDVIKQIISAFELNEDYEEFEIEIIFSDGTKMEFETKQ